MWITHYSNGTYRYFFHSHMMLISEIQVFLKGNWWSSQHIPECKGHNLRVVRDVLNRVSDYFLWLYQILFEGWPQFLLVIIWGVEIIQHLFLLVSHFTHYDNPSLFNPFLLLNQPLIVWGPQDDTFRRRLGWNGGEDGFWMGAFDSIIFRHQPDLR